MTVSSVKCLTDDALRHGLLELVAQDRKTTVRLLIHMAEFQSRGLFREAGYASMFQYCVGELRMSRDVAYKRVRVAGKARRFPRILSGIFDGSLGVSTVALLVPDLEIELKSRGKGAEAKRPALREGERARARSLRGCAR